MFNNLEKLLKFHSTVKNPRIILLGKCHIPVIDKTDTTEALREVNLLLLGRHQPVFISDMLKH